MKRITGVIAVVASLVPRLVLAGDSPKVNDGFAIENPLGADNVVDILKEIAGAIQDLVIPVAAAMYIYAGFLWVTAGAKPENLTKAKTVFKYATIGLVVVFIGGGFVDLIQSVLNLGS